MKKMKRILTLMMTIILIAGMMPLSAFAEEAQEDLAIVSLNNDAEKAVDILEDETTDQVGLSSTISASSNTENIVGEAFANTINASLESQNSGNDQADKLDDDYPKDVHHDRDYYGDSLRVRDLENGNYLVYRDSYLIISQEDSAGYSVTYSNDDHTARVSPGISNADLVGKIGIVFLDQSLDKDMVLVFDGDPHNEEDGLVVPLAATEDITIYRLFSDGKLSFHGECHDEDANGKPSFDWETDLSGTNWSGKITDERVNDVDFVCDVDLWGADISFGINLDLSIDFDITTTGASDGTETSKAVSITIPVGTLFNADVIYSVRAQFEEEPIQVKGTLQTNFDYTFSIIAGGEIHKYRNPVTISELKVLNPEDYNKAINFYLGSQITSRLAVLEYKIKILWWDIKIGPILSMNANWYGGCFILARHEKDQYDDKPDPTKDEIHFCAKKGEDGCLSLNKEERYGFNIDITIDFTPIADEPWEWDIYSDDQFVERTYNYNSYTLKTGMQSGNCPHKGYRIDVKVDTNLKTSTEGASVTYTPVEDEFKPFASAVVDNDNTTVLFSTADKTIDVKAELTSPHDSEWKISDTVSLEMTPGGQFLPITLEIPEKHIYFKNPASGKAKDWPEDFTFAPFMSNTVTVPDNIPELSGFQFLGWNTAEDGSGTDYQPGDTFIQEDDLTLWAQWEKAETSWYVIYNANGGKNTPKPQIVPKGTDAVLSQELPVAGTLTFKGWSTNSSAAAVEYHPGDTLPYDESKNVVVLYALWELDPVKRPIHITYDANGLEGASVPADVWIEQDGWYQLKSAVAPLGSAYAFKGWSKKPGTEDPEYLPNHSYYFDRDTALYAIWGDVTKTLTFMDTQSGKVSDMPEAITIVPSMSPNVRIPDQIPQKSGRVFSEWNTNEDGSGSAYAPGSQITLNEDITLWAQWKEAGSSWYVIYNANGGTKAPEPQIVTQGEDAVLSQELPESGTLIFKGWTPDLKSIDPVYQKGDTLPYDSEKRVVVLYALWELDPVERPINITFEANGAEGVALPEDIWMEPGWLQLGHAVPQLGSLYTFLGWSEDPGSKKPQYLAGKYYYFDEDTALFAIWKKLDTKTLTFMDQSPYTATEMPQPITVTPSMPQKVKIPTQVPKKPGRFFTGWNTEKDGSGMSYRPGSEISLTSSMHLWAQWDLEAISLLEAHVTVLIDPYPFASDPENPKKKPEPPIRVMLYGEEVPSEYYDAVYEPSRSEVKPWKVKVVGKGEYTDDSYWSYFGISDDIETFTYELIPDQTYTGKALKPHVNVYFAGKLLTDNKDYTITYKDNVNAYGNKVNNATFVIKGKGNYSGTEEGSFSILPRNILDEGLSISEIESIVYNPRNPKEYKPVPKLNYNRMNLKKDRDFTVRYYTDAMCTKQIDAPKEIGRYYVGIEGIGNYTETRYLQFDILDPTLKPVSKLTVGRIPDQPYTGETINVNDLNLLVKDGGKTLVMGVDYEATTSSVAAGKGEVIITGKEEKGYSGSRAVSYNITGIPMNKVTVTGLPKTRVYNGSPQKPEFTLSYRKNLSSEAETISYTTKEKYDRMTPDKQKKIDCVVVYGENTNVGTGTVTLTGVNRCSGTIKKTFNIAKFDISPGKDTENNFTVTLSEYTYRFEKAGVKPKPVVRFYRTVLEENKDYTVAYANNKKLSDPSSDVKPTVIIKGKGPFKGTDATTSFKILKADMKTEGISVDANDVLYKDKAGNWKTKVAVADRDGKNLSAGRDYDKDIMFTLDEEGKDVIPEDAKLNPGTVVYVTVKAKEGSAYSGSVTGSYRIVNNDIDKLRASVEPKEFTGEEIKLKKTDISWKQNGKVVDFPADNFEIIESTYKNNINKGTATVVVRGKGDWGGTKTISFKITSRGFLWWISNQIL